MYYDKTDSLIKNLAGIIASSDFLYECKYAFDDDEKNSSEHSNSDFSDFFDDITIKLMENRCYGFYSDGTLPIEGCPVEALAFKGKFIGGEDSETQREAISYYIGMFISVLKNNIAYLHRILQMDAEGKEFSSQSVDYFTSVSSKNFSLKFYDDGVTGDIEQIIPFSVIDGTKYSYTNVAVIKKEDYEKERSKLSGIIGAINNSYAQYALESKIFNEFSELVVTDLQDKMDFFKKSETKIKMIRTIIFVIDEDNPEHSIIDCITIYGNEILMPNIKSKQREMIDRKLDAIRNAFMEDNEIG